MWRPLDWFRGLSVHLQVALGVGLGVTFVTLGFALLLNYTTQQGIDTAKEDRLRRTQMIAFKLDELLEGAESQPEYLPELISLSGDSTTFVTSVVDEKGTIIATSSDRAIEDFDEHLALMRDLVSERSAGVRVYDGPNGDHIVAYAPLESIAAGVLIEAPQDKVIATPLRLLHILPFFGLGVMLVASISAWIHVKYVLRPLTRLERATARIAGGIIDEPITTTRRDEVGQLARSFETMRVQLKAASDERAGWERDLEHRVEARTAEVHRLVRRVITAQEEERRRLSQELHDDTAQALAALLMGMEALRDSLPRHQPQVRQHVERSIDQGRSALEDLRRVILGLRPAAIDDLGLVAALRSYAVARLDASGVHLNFSVHGAERALPQGIEMGLFRILQEAVTNVARHAGAQNTEIRLEFEDAQLVATITDDGQGFDTSQATGRGLGLEGMRERAEIINAQLEVTSAPGQGAKVKVILPL